MLQRGIRKQNKISERVNKNFNDNILNLNIETIDMFNFMGEDMKKRIMSDKKYLEELEVHYDL